MPRRLARVRGDLETLLTDPALAGLEDHWVQATLTDAVRPAHPMERLRAAVPARPWCWPSPRPASAVPRDPRRRSAGPPRPRGRARLRGRRCAARRPPPTSRRCCSRPATPAADDPDADVLLVRGRLMRLHRLSVTAFGPFVETADVDFDALSDAGLFLLSGATGAGKSSVLDAVCFALYGAIPGDRNHAGRLRSDQAPPGWRPRVELDVTRRRAAVHGSSAPPPGSAPRSAAPGRPASPPRSRLSERRDDEWCPLSSRLDEAGDLLLGAARHEPRPVLPGGAAPPGPASRPSCGADSAQRHQLLARLFRTGRFERVEGWLRDHRLTLRRDSQTHLTAVSDLVSRLSEAAGGARCPSELGDLSAAAADGVVGSWSRGLLRRADDRPHGRGDVRRVRPRPRHATPRRRGSSPARPRGPAPGSSRRPPPTSGSRPRPTSHAAEVARLDAARRAEGLRPVARLVDERAHRLADAEAAARAALGRGRSRRARRRRRCRPSWPRLAHEVSALTLLLPAEERLAELRARAHASRAEELRTLPARRRAGRGRGLDALATLVTPARDRRPGRRRGRAVAAGGRGRGRSPPPRRGGPQRHRAAAGRAAPWRRPTTPRPSGGCSTCASGCSTSANAGSPGWPPSSPGPSPSATTVRSAVRPTTRIRPGPRRPPRRGGRARGPASGRRRAGRRARPRPAGARGDSRTRRPPAGRPRPATATTSTTAVGGRRAALGATAAAAARRRASTAQLAWPSAAPRRRRRLRPRRTTGPRSPS